MKPPTATRSRSPAAPASLPFSEPTDQGHAHVAGTAHPYGSDASYEPYAAATSRRVQAATSSVLAVSPDLPRLVAEGAAEALPRRELSFDIEFILILTNLPPGTASQVSRPDE